MKIFIDIGHPAHVHYYRNMVKIMQSRKHEFLITARNRPNIFELLRNENLAFYGRGKGAKSLAGKLLYLLYADIYLLIKALVFKPDMFISFTSPYAAHVSKILRKPHISFDDTEHARLGQLSYRPYTEAIITPSCYTKNIGNKQIRFNGYMELCYLHPKRFKPDSNIFNLLGINADDKYILFRFVSWNASHDIGQNGLDFKAKLLLIETLSEVAKIFISSEGELPENLKPYQLKTTPEKIHDVMAFAALFIGEGATMASECAMLGTPAIYVNSLTAGTIEDQQRLGLLFSFRNAEGVLEKSMELLNQPKLRTEFQTRRLKMLEDKIDVTAFMVWLIENYPESIKTMKTNPDYQNIFK